MARNDDGFNLDDMMEIFGETLEASPKASASSAAATAVKPAPAAPVHSTSSSDSLSDDEMAILAAYEKSKKEQKVKDEEAKRKKDDEARKILEQYERELKEARERETKLKKELEDRQRRELDELKKKQAAEVNKEEEERRIIEEFERQAKQQKEKEEAERKVKEDRAQAELKALADKQKIEEETRRVEEARREEEIKVKAAQAVGDKKEGRLLELLAKAKAELDANAPPPLSSPASAPSSLGGKSAKDLLIDIEQKECDAFLFMLDETRKAMFTYLAPLIGIKAANNMLNKTVEKARTKAPIILKDANWRTDGSLREDGSIDNERVLANLQKISVATRVDEFLAGLHALVGMRFAAVDQGLGANTALGMRHRVGETRTAFVGKSVQKDWIDLFFSNVIGN